MAKLSVNELFDTLAANPSKTFKIEFMKANADNMNFKEAIRLALDPHVQFYIRKIPFYTPIPDMKNALTLSEAIEQLGNLSSRKYTGNAAILFLQDLLNSLHYNDAKVIERIIQKDPRCGIDTSPNKVWKNLIPDYPVMLCERFNQKLVDKMHFPAMVQMKMDGMRFNAVVYKGKVTFYTRVGKVLDFLGNLEKEFIEMADGMNIVFDGELLVEGMDRKTGNGILLKAQKGKISAKEAALVQATLWDSIPYSDFLSETNRENYDYRFARVQAALQRTDSDKIHCVTFTIVQTYEEAKKLFELYYSQGHEGIILKNLQSPWEPKRARHQIKLKGEEECDLLITDTYEGKGKAKGMLGGISGCTYETKLKVDVGSGFSDEQRKYLWKIRKTLPGQVMAVKYNAKIQKEDGTWSLFLPIFVEIRSDKTKPDFFKDIK